MKHEQLAQALDLLAPELVEEAACVWVPKRHILLHTLAACLCAAVLTAAALGWLQLSAPFRDVHFSEEMDRFAVETSLQRIPMTAFSEAFLAGIAEETDTVILYYDDLEAASAALGYPLLEQTRSVPRYQYFENRARVQMFVSCYEAQRPAVIYLQQVMVMVQQMNRGPVSLTVVESQSLYTEHYRYSELRTGVLWEGEYLLSAEMLTAADGTPVCVYSKGERLPDGVQESWNAVFRRQGVLVELQIIPERPVARQEILAFLQELVDSYAWVEGETT